MNDSDKSYLLQIFKDLEECGYPDQDRLLLLGGELDDPELHEWITTQWFAAKTTIRKAMIAWYLYGLCNERTSFTKGLRAVILSMRETLESDPKNAYYYGIDVCYVHGLICLYASSVDASEKESLLPIVIAAYEQRKKQRKHPLAVDDLYNTYVGPVRR